MKERDWTILYLLVSAILIAIGFLFMSSLACAKINTRIPNVINNFYNAKVGPVKILPKQSIVIRTFTAKITSYNSEPSQTDSSPFITADGTRVKFGVVAANCLKFGTKLRIPKIFGNKVFVVHDRGSFGCSLIDVWMPIGGVKGWKGTTTSKVEIIK